MKRRGLVKQLLLFCLVGFVVTSVYNSIVSQVNELNVKEVTAKSTTKRILNFIPSTRTFPKNKFKINCRKIIEKDKDEIDRATALMRVSPPSRLQNGDYINATQDCVYFRKSFRYDNYPVTNEEKEFPIAFSIITYQDVDQTERLLRAIYRPQNLYCIHADASSPDSLHRALAGIADCFGNVFIVSKKEDIIYNHMSRLKADLNCMSDILSMPQKWKYFINLPHQQFPLKTNLEMVKILKTYNGANDIEGIITHGRMMPSRFEFSHKYVNDSWKRIGKRTSKLPLNATIVKGSAYGVFSREFVQYTITDKRAKDVLKFMEDVKSPDEYYWATLNHNEVLKAPGRYSGNPEKKPWLAVYASWGGRDRCHGKYVRGVCVFGVGDLNELVSKKELFANKFYPDFQYLALDCLEEYIYNKTFSHLPFETFYYKQLPFIRKQ
ncbi:beta-1,3-galactosyl-O-glycosyl-glycoprotein beta-1,6-N-acetylglucosaminyltransferase-like [Mytilus edulis]|uniref:beta-1,3-galactosyl-O-glycosyl-glycoprotein beta-1,6-N-acetylglucosaminyltransferase-like n=1 Tax=Mytilus edulis TaxID=6550 RepID=UPI0039F01593